MKFARILAVLLCASMGLIAAPANAGRDAVLIEPVQTFPAGQKFTPAEIKKAIIAGGMRHTWRMVNEKDNVVRLQLDSRKGEYTLVIDVIFTANNYTIKYVDSAGLRYREEGNGIRMIHSSFVRWMKNLTDAIDLELKIIKL